jgi:hypothetical protein
MCQVVMTNQTRNLFITAASCTQFAFGQGSLSVFRPQHRVTLKRYLKNCMLSAGFSIFIDEPESTCFCETKSETFLVTM